MSDGKVKGRGDSTGTANEYTPEERPVSYSKVEQSYFVRPQHINAYGRLFGGTLLEWMDELAGVVARRHASAEVTTACIDTAEFIGPAVLNEMVVLEARITYVGRSSMEVRVDTFAEERSGMRTPITRAYFVMVAINETGVPQPVPRLGLENEQQRAEFQLGRRRYDLRKQRKQEGY